MNIDAMREALATLYGPVWREKVKTMPADQVIAVYRAMQLRGKLK